MNVYHTKNKIFEQEIDRKISTALEIFETKIKVEMDKKPNKDFIGKDIIIIYSLFFTNFITIISLAARMGEKAGSEEFGKLYLNVNQMKIDLHKLIKKVEGKADDKSNGPTKLEEEVMRLAEEKVDIFQLDNVKHEIQNLHQLVDELHEDYSDSYDEYDDLDSEVEDVISLEGAALSGDKEEEGDEEDFFDSSDPAKNIAEKAKELTSKSNIQQANFEPTAKIGEINLKVEEINLKKEEEEKKAKEEEKVKEEEKAKEEEKKASTSNLKDLNKDVKEELTKNINK